VRPVLHSAVDTGAAGLHVHADRRSAPAAARPVDGHHPAVGEGSGACGGGGPRSACLLRNHRRPRPSWPSPATARAGGPACGLHGCDPSGPGARHAVSPPLQYLGRQLPATSPVCWRDATPGAGPGCWTGWPCGIQPSRAVLLRTGARAERGASRPGATGGEPTGPPSAPEAPRRTLPRRRWTLALLPTPTCAPACLAPPWAGVPWPGPPRTGRWRCRAHWRGNGTPPGHRRRAALAGRRLGRGGRGRAVAGPPAGYRLVRQARRA